MNNQVMRRLILVGGFVVAVLFWFFSDRYALWTVHAPILLVFLSSYLLNIYNWGIIISFGMWKRWRGVLAGFLLTLWWSLISLPHTIRNVVNNSTGVVGGVLPSDPQLYAYVDTLLWRTLPFLEGFGWFGTFFIYVVVSFGLLYFSSVLLFPKQFVNVFKKKFKL